MQGVDRRDSGAPARHARHRLEVEGIVQGVGFRPFVYTLARSLDLTGLVRNQSTGVTIEIEGLPGALDAFHRRLLAEAPPLARIQHVAVVPIDPVRDGGFMIVETRASTGRTFLPPDVSLCDDCRRELHDPANRRYRHPFINCTNCGPRFTIIRALPYDRPATTLASFPMCSRCAAEYRDPADRRFHAQPVACRDCGPRVWLEVSHPFDEPAEVHGDAALERTLDLLAAGAIVALKGIGGFHLACDATSPEAVATLRARKLRPAKPLAVMVPDVEAAGRLARLSAEAQRTLESIERPIVLADGLPSSDLAPAVSPRLEQVGVMLPYSPLHELLLSAWGRRCRARTPSASGALVMTSGNLADEPVITDNADARRRLAPVADAFLLHDRPIHMRCDDSVVASVAEAVVVPVRRSRGYAPMPIRLPMASPCLLAVGAELKATFCLAHEHTALMSQHIGDMENVETLDAFSEAVDHFCRIFHLEPAHYVCDAHPGYRSAQWAGQAAGGPLIRVQHHHAHVASLMVEHGLDGSTPLLAFCFDGTGYGTDGAIWGGEVLRADYRSFDRVAHFAYAPLPGGDAAVRRPYRMALACLREAGIEWEDLPPARACSPAERTVLARQLERRVGVVPTSSLGRLFDAVASLVGIRQTASYEAQPAIELEALAPERPEMRYRFVLRHNGAGDPLQIDWIPVVEAIVADLRSGVTAPAISGAFHAALSALVVEIAEAVAGDGRRAAVGLTGGVFQNRYLLVRTSLALERAGFTVLDHRVVPPNDGGLALGQAAIGAARLAGAHGA